VIRVGVGLLLLQAVLPASARTQQTAGASIPVQMGYRVNPDTVIIGQPFNLFVKIAAPMGVRFEFPAGPDTAMQNGVRPIELRGEKLVSMLGDTAVALYHLVAWDVGIQPLRLPDIRAALGGQERRLPLSGAFVFVKSILPADTSLRVPKPPRPLIILPVFNWWPWLALLAALIAAVLLWWAWRRYRNRPQKPVDPYVRAQREFERIERMGLLEADRGAEYFALFVDVAREYLAARVPGVRRSDTTSELLRAMQPHDGAEAELPGLLERADLVKFAREGLTRDGASAAALAIRAIVDHVEARLNPESEPAKKAATRERAA
jgi:membrane protein implicated in regulation of membrane protease activity